MKPTESEKMNIEVTTALASWLTANVSGVEFKKGELLILLGYQQSAEWNALDKFSIQKNIFIGIFLAILGFGAVFNEGSNMFIWLFVPAFLVVLRYYVLLAMDRYYQRFLEAVVYTAKVEYLLGLHNKLKILNNVEYDKPLYKDDVYFGVSRHWDNRFNNKHEDSKSWVREFMNKGHNKVARELFTVICVCSIFFIYWYWIKAEGFNAIKVTHQSVRATIVFVSMLICTEFLHKFRR